MRISSAIVLLALAACRPAPETRSVDANAQLPAAGRTDAIACAQGVDAPMKTECTVDQAMGENGLVLTLRRPDGSFRRLLVTKDGRGVVAADGAVPATVSVLSPERIVVTIGDDRYELPATVKGAASPAK